MKRLILPLTLLLTVFATVPLLAVDSSQRPTLVQDVIRMAQGGVGDQGIIAFVQNRRGTYTVTADDMIAMSEARVSNEVVKFVADAAATRDPSWRDGNGEAEDATREQRTETVRERTVYVQSPRVYVSPYWDPFYSYDPFWYGPRLSLNLGFGYYGGFGRGYGGGYRGGIHRGGGFHRGRH